LGGSFISSSRGWSWGGADLLGQVDVPLVDQASLDLRKTLGELGHDGFELVLFLELLNHVGVDAIREKDAHQELHGQLELGPKAQISPDALECDVDVAVGQDESGPGLLGHVNAFEHLGPGLDAELLTKPAVERAQDELGQQKDRLLLADDLEDVHLPPVIGLSHGLVAGLA
jgi:hypothetical protein